MPTEAKKRPTAVSLCQFEMVRGRYFRTSQSRLDAHFTSPVPPASLIVRCACDQFLAQDGNIGGCFDSQSHLMTVDLDYRDRNLGPYQDLLRQFPTQNEHLYLLAISKRLPIVCHFRGMSMSIVS
jgi:hypothetical protein